MSKLNENAKKIMLHSVETTGHLNACIGFAQALSKHGHEIVFIVNETVQQTVEKFGFRVIPLIKEKPKGTNGEECFAFSDNPAKSFAKSLLENGILSSKSPLEKMKYFIKNKKFISDMTNSIVEFNPQIEKALKEEKPDCWIHDQYFVPPAVLLSKIPWVLVCSSAPLTYYDTPLLPPGFSGYPTNDQTQWKAFKEYREKNLKEVKNNQDRINRMFGYSEDGAKENKNHRASPYLNVYHYPLELEYVENGFKNPDNFVGVDTFIRNEPDKFEPPQELTSIKSEGDKMIYFSIGSMGGFNVELMKKVLGALAKLPYRIIVSKGPRGNEFELPANCWGKNFLPQLDIVQLVDLVITHGGNNTFTETFAAGKQMIVMPLWGDQYENAQRLKETGYGISLNPYDFQEQELIDAVNKLINDQELIEKLQQAKQRISQSSRMDEACKRVEQIIEKYSSK